MSRASIMAGSLLIAWGCIQAYDTPVAKHEPPSAVKSGSQYVLGPEDQISIRVLQAPEISDKLVRIDLNGLIEVPFVGQIKAGGLTVEELRAELTNQLRAYIREPLVSVTVEEFRSQPVSVIGAVNTPGILQLRGHKTLIEILSLAGGLRPDSGNAIKITRKSQYGALTLPNSRLSADGQYSVATVEVKTLMEAKDPQLNIHIEPEDVISIPRAEMVYVVGEISRAGGFVLNERESISVLKALALAGGLNRTASPQNAKILRTEADGGKSGEIAVDLNKILTGRTKDVDMKPDDILFVPGSASKRASLRALEAAIQAGTGVVIWRR